LMSCISCVLVIFIVRFPSVLAAGLLSVYK
jgi:hypothetical protein